ncbi:MAG: hypothetical protein DBX59_10905 [Bacillota bacterium]|nr:MAG: hypothetical protein DBX59_10905 [Bacillota bacterium]
MITLQELAAQMEKLCPLSLSEACKKKGMYDNSGLLVSRAGGVNGVLFSLDLSRRAVAEAVHAGCDCIVTHHPAIYGGMERIYESDVAAGAVYDAIKRDIAVFSQHLNLDLAAGGIDDMLAYGLGATSFETIDKLAETAGYGKAFTLAPTTAGDICERVEREFKTRKYILYGSPDKRVETAASFCGAGGSDAAAYAGKADLIVTSDAPHHVIREIAERGGALLLLPHYAAENYGFKAFFAKMKGALGARAKAEYFEDERYL